MKKLWLLTLAVTCSAFAVVPESDGIREVFGTRYRAAVSAPSSNAKHVPKKGVIAVRRWNEIAINASGLDHTPVAIGENRHFGEQLGPCRAARAMAIVHIAMFDTVNSVAKQYQGYTSLRAPHGPISMQAAIAQAAHDSLTNLFPSQTATFDARLAEDLAEVKSRPSRRLGVKLGQRAAAAILTLRAHDGSEHPEVRVNDGADGYYTSDLPGHWRQDPISQIPLALGALWHECIPFVMSSSSQFRCPPPPTLDSFEYAMAYNEAKSLGGDGIKTFTERTAEQTRIGLFWAYDGTPSLCAPPRLYNQITIKIADLMETSDFELAHLLALVNVAMADTGMAVWDSKYYYDFWRPITGIRESDSGSGPTGAGDGNDLTTGDPGFSPLGAPASNLQGPNFTPPFPAYPSGHAGFGGALFQTLRRYYKTDCIPFSFTSDEFNGVTKDNQGNVRPLLPRTFTSLSQAEEENGQSRIYLGIHWAFDKSEGIAQGRRVADHVFEHIYQPVPKKH